LDLQILSTPADTTIGAREGIEFGVSDVAFYLSPCAQSHFYNMEQGSCQPDTGYSTFYNLAQNDYSYYFPTVNMQPAWLSVMKPPGISSAAHEVYSWLRGTKLEVIIGTLGKPHFKDIDLRSRLEHQINATHVASNNNTYDLSFLANRASQNIIGNYSNGTITSYGKNYNNLFGNSFYQSKVNDFKFAFGITTGWACVGMIETQNINTLDLNADLRNQSLVVCSDRLAQPETKFLVSIETATNTIHFQDLFYKQSKTLQFNNANDLYYTVQFHNRGTVYFGQSADAYQEGGILEQ